MAHAPIFVVPVITLAYGHVFLASLQAIAQRVEGFISRHWSPVEVLEPVEHSVAYRAPDTQPNVVPGPFLRTSRLHRTGRGLFYL